MTARLLTAYLLIGFTSVFGQSNWVQIKKITPNVRGAYDFFGFRSAISDNKIYVGAYQEDENENDQQTMAYSGSVYVFAPSGNGWVQERKICASDRANGAQFGREVEVYGDKMFVSAYSRRVAGLYTAGSVYAYSRNANGVWTEDQIISANTPRDGGYFGNSITYHDNTLAVASKSGGVNVYDYNEASRNYVFRQLLLTQSGSPIPSQDVCSGDGFIFVGLEQAFTNSLARSGRAYVYKKMLPVTGH